VESRGGARRFGWLRTCAAGVVAIVRAVTIEYGQGFPGEQALRQAIQSWSAQGWTIQHAGAAQAVLVKPHKWVPHLVVSVLTCGLWLFVWPVIAYVPKRKVTLTIVDGQVSAQLSRN